MTRSGPIVCYIRVFVVTLLFHETFCNFKGYFIASKTKQLLHIKMMGYIKHTVKVLSTLVVGVLILKWA